MGKRWSINGKEFDTYKVGTVANSCSTMHKIAAKEFMLEDFSCEHLVDCEDTYIYSGTCEEFIGPKETLKVVIDMLNESRREYLETKDKKYWWQMIQLLPSSYNQKRTVMLNYEVLANIYKSRKNHKLDEWAEHDDIDIRTLKRYYNGDFKLISPDKALATIGFCDWIKTLPYSEIIIGPVNEGVVINIDPGKVTPEAMEYIKKILKEDHGFGFDARKE